MEGLHCPLCGRETDMQIKDMSDGTIQVFCYIECPDCGLFLRGKVEPTVEKAKLSLADRLSVPSFRQYRLQVYADTLRTVIGFLLDNKRHGDDWSDEINDLNDLLDGLDPKSDEQYCYMELEWFDGRPYACCSKCGAHDADFDFDEPWAYCHNCGRSIVKKEELEWASRIPKVIEDA